MIIFPLHTVLYLDLPINLGTVFLVLKFTLGIKLHPDNTKQLIKIMIKFFIYLPFLFPINKINLLWLMYFYIYSLMCHILTLPSLGHRNT